jgi:hypothetical protein
MAYNFITKEPKLAVLCKGKWLPKDYHLSPTPKQNRGDKKCKDYRELET